MIFNILYLVLAALALGILVFLHELGHYLVARREGMKVEAFSIGFGKPVLVWKRDDVHWQLCWIPFGGYVKIAGMEKQGSLEPSEIKDGFYGKGPWPRIKVALAGPVVNIALALVLFTGIWLTGGREKMFSEYTHLIGWVEPQSGLYESGVRPGDEISTYDNQPFTGFRQIAYAAVLDKGSQEIGGEKINYFESQKAPFSYNLDFGDVNGIEKASLAMRMLSPANYLIYHQSPSDLEDSAMTDSGIENNDRILWVDGELIFSRKQLSSVINQPKALLSVERAGSVFLTRIPRLQIGDLRLSAQDKAELQDLEYSLEENEVPFLQMHYIPYEVAPNCLVEKEIAYIDDTASEKTHFESANQDLERALQPGDRIIAVDGFPVENIQQFFRAIQKRHVQMVVVRGKNHPPISWESADEAMMEGISFQSLQRLVQSIGTQKRLSSDGDLFLLNPVQPRPRYEFPLTQSLKERLVDAVGSQQAAKKGKGSDAERHSSLKMLEANQKQVMLGIALTDRVVKYNPSPLHLLTSALQETWKTLYALVTGYVSPKFLAGPVGIVEVIHHGWTQGLKEALFWIAIISLNLGIVNLMPIPVLDGGHICFALYELVTGKAIKAKTMERLVIPFVVLFIAFFIYLTYQDVLRILSRFF